jgi:3-hydroxyisobutyrate dehydrogenase
MGLPMIRNLLRAQFHVMGFDLNPNAAKSLTQEANFKAATSPTQVAQHCDIVILMLPNSKIVDALLWDEPHALALHLNASQVVVDMGSSDPIHTRENFTKLAALNIPFCDAPVSGGVKRATDGSLSIMMGGETSTIEKIRHVLEALGKTLVHVGSSGAGHAVKALNNYVSAAGLLAVSEALVAAEKFGIDPHLVNQVFNASTGKNNTTEVKVENFMLSGTFNSGFSLALMRKDLQTALNFIERMGTHDDFVTVCTQTWTQAESKLDKGADHTAMYKFTQESS